MSEQKKLTKQNNILWIIVAVVVIAFCAYSFLTSDTFRRFASYQWVRN